MYTNGTYKDRNKKGKPEVHETNESEILSIDTRQAPAGRSVIRQRDAGREGGMK